MRRRRQALAVRAMRQNLMLARLRGQLARVEHFQLQGSGFESHSGVYDIFQIWILY